MKTIAEKLAVSLLAISGRRAISDLYDAAIVAYLFDKPEVADSLIEIAEAAERVDGNAAVTWLAPPAWRGSEPFTARKPKGREGQLRARRSQVAGP